VRVGERRGYHYVKHYRGPGLSDPVSRAIVTPTVPPAHRSSRPALIVPPESRQMFPSLRCPGPMTRRHFLGAGAFGVGALSMPELFRMRAAASETPPTDDTAVILLW